MDDTCPCCAGAAPKYSTKQISAIPGSRISRCESCGSFWLEEVGKWQLLLQTESESDQSVPSEVV